MREEGIDQRDYIIYRVIFQYHLITNLSMLPSMMREPSTAIEQKYPDVLKKSIVRYNLSIAPIQNDLINLIGKSQ